MKNLALITARSGSKGVKGKNIRDLNGKPLMAWTIEAALESGEFDGEFDEVMVSTDSEEYAAIARSYGAKVPFLRSAEASRDTAPSSAAIDEVLRMYRELGRTFDNYCLLQPTSPLRTGEDIRRAYRLFREKSAVAVVSVCEADHPPTFCGHLPENHEMVGFVDERKFKRRQDYETFYRINGAIYIIDVEKSRGRSIYGEGGYAYVMDRMASVDIDAEFDFRLAEFLMRERGRQGEQ